MSDYRTLPSPILFSRKVENETIEVPFHRFVTITCITESSATLYFGDTDQGVYINPSFGHNLHNVMWNKVNTIEVVGSAFVTVEEGWR